MNIHSEPRKLLVLNNWKKYKNSDWDKTKQKRRFCMSVCSANGSWKIREGGFRRSRVENANALLFPLLQGTHSGQWSASSYEVIRGRDEAERRARNRNGRSQSSCLPPRCSCGQGFSLRLKGFSDEVPDPLATHFTIVISYRHFLVSFDTLSIELLYIC